MGAALVASAARASKGNWIDAGAPPPGRGPRGTAAAARRRERRGLRRGARRSSTAGRGDDRWDRDVALGRALARAGELPLQIAEGPRTWPCSERSPPAACSRPCGRTWSRPPPSARARARRRTPRRRQPVGARRRRAARRAAAWSRSRGARQDALALACRSRQSPMTRFSHSDADLVARCREATTTPGVRSSNASPVTYWPSRARPTPLASRRRGGVSGGLRARIRAPRTSARRSGDSAVDRQLTRRLCVDRLRAETRERRLETWMEPPERTRRCPSRRGAHRAGGAFDALRGLPRDPRPFLLP